MRKRLFLHIAALVFYLLVSAFFIQAYFETEQIRRDAGRYFAGASKQATAVFLERTESLAFNLIGMQQVITLMSLVLAVLGIYHVANSWSRQKHKEE